MNNTNNGKTAQQLAKKSERRVQRGAQNLVNAGKGNWILCNTAGWGTLCNLWRSPDQSTSLATNITGEIYGDE